MAHILFHSQLGSFYSTKNFTANHNFKVPFLIEIKVQLDFFSTVILEG